MALPSVLSGIIWAFTRHKLPNVGFEPPKDVSSATLFSLAAIILADNRISMFILCSLRRIIDRGVEIGKQAGCRFAHVDSLR